MNNRTKAIVAGASVAALLGITAGTAAAGDPNYNPECVKVGIGFDTKWVDSKGNTSDGRHYQVVDPSNCKPKPTTTTVRPPVTTTTTVPVTTTLAPPAVTLPPAIPPAAKPPTHLAPAPPVVAPPAVTTTVPVLLPSVE